MEKHTAERATPGSLRVKQNNSIKQKNCVFPTGVCVHLKSRKLSGKIKPKLVRVRREERVNVTLSLSVILFNGGKVIMYYVYD